MIVTIDVPDVLPAERMRKRIEEFEKSLFEEAGFWQKIKVVDGNFCAETREKSLLESFGSWQDERDAETIIDDLRQSRASSGREVSI
jgi:hypothetical protein